MKQDLEFFDEPQNSVSILTGRLAIDTSEVNQVREGGRERVRENWRRVGSYANIYLFCLPSEL